MFIERGQSNYFTHNPLVNMYRVVKSPRFLCNSSRSIRLLSDFIYKVSQKGFLIILVRKRCISVMEKKLEIQK